MSVRSGSVQEEMVAKKSTPEALLRTKEVSGDWEPFKEEGHAPATRDQTQSSRSEDSDIVPPELLNKFEKTEAFDGVLDDSQSPPYLTWDQIIRRRRSIETEKTRASLEFAQWPSLFVGQSPITNIWDSDGGFSQKRFSFIQKELAYHERQNPMKPSMKRNMSWFKTMKQDFMEIFFGKKKQDEMTAELSDDEVIEAMIDKHDLKMRKKSLRQGRRERSIIRRVFCL